MSDRYRCILDLHLGTLFNCNWQEACFWDCNDYVDEYSCHFAPTPTVFLFRTVLHATRCSWHWLQAHSINIPTRNCIGFNEHRFLQSEWISCIWCIKFHWITLDFKEQRQVACFFVTLCLIQSCFFIWTSFCTSSMSF